jgi:PilZ domain
VDSQEIKQRLREEVSAQAERRNHPRVRMRVGLKLRGSDALGNYFEELTATENVSASGFLCSCPVPLAHGSLVQVYLVGASSRYVGTARVVRKDSSPASDVLYGFKLEEKTDDWILQN